MTALCAQESIYNLLPRVEEKPIKLPRYISTFRPSVKHEIEENRAPWKTMGPAKNEVPSPKNFLLKHSKEPKLPDRKRDEGRKRLLTIPSVPHVKDHPLLGIQSKKNFINTNAANVIMGVAKKPQPICVDTRQGNKYLLETSGLVPKYINKKRTFEIHQGESPRTREVPFLFTMKFCSESLESLRSPSPGTDLMVVLPQSYKPLKPRLPRSWQAGRETGLWSYSQIRN
ncbi:enkurin isoform X2 [Mauremys mutica]|uniref:enkurin isoform X2 n=1 Tax=Mauremys mutica TaxID=74926 RepID=UPI001D15F785|nr:enkurin isoform X2 [Mauremys mutica]